MRTSGQSSLPIITAMCATMLGLFGCSADSSTVDSSSDELRGGVKKELTCEADNGATLAVVGITGGKFALITLAPTGDLYAMSRKTGTLTASRSRYAWTGSSSSLTLGSNLKGTWERGDDETDVTCEATSATNAASWRTANALIDYGYQIDGLAEAVLEESEDPKPKDYSVFAIETGRRNSLSLGRIARNSSGRLPGSEDDQSLLDENDFGYGGISAAYGLGGGDDYGEWFQAASDGISLFDSVGPSLTGSTRAGFIAREQVTSLASLVDRASSPSAVEITVGPWTFFLPDAFPK